MNKIVFGLFVIIGLIIVGAVFLLQPQKNDTVPQTEGITTNQVTSSTGKNYSLKDVAAHADRTSCWTAINGKVYDLTSFVGQHPGGTFKILTICGKDGSEAFNPEHRNNAQAQNELQSLYIGDLSSE